MAFNFGFDKENTSPYYQFSSINSLSSNLCKSPEKEFARKVKHTSPSPQKSNKARRPLSPVNFTVISKLECPGPKKGERIFSSFQPKRLDFDVDCENTCSKTFEGQLTKSVEESHVDEDGYRINQQIDSKQYVYNETLGNIALLSAVSIEHEPLINRVQCIQSPTGAAILAFKQFQELSRLLHSRFNIQQMKNVYSYILEQGLRLLEVDFHLHSYVQYTHDNVKIFAAKRGKLYLEINSLGEGAHKVAMKVAKVYDKNTPNFHVVHTKAMVMDKTTKCDHAMHDEEFTINQALYKQHKILPLRYICVGKPMSIRIFGSGNSTKLGLISPYANGGNINSLLTMNPFLSFKEKAKIVLDMAKAVEELHHLGIIHRDIKPDNFLIFNEDQGIVVKIADFGTSSFVDFKKSFKTQVVLPSAWIPPELSLKGSSKLDFAIDIYQLGVTFYQVFSIVTIETLPFYYIASAEILKKFQGLPYDNSIVGSYTTSEMEKFEEILSLSSHPMDRLTFCKSLKALPRLWPRMTTLEVSVKEMLFKMIDNDPKKRPSISQVIHFFNQL